ncbi:hypothetical protein [Evansella cellulosilytica]|uniref:Uncharacterized protein n=1 Tax=Evansella cellulosilytica (strain ATCC 21833 / DSM 2522 / FERM P-1141 / JCM 9156 / N-4) TaxID=649639 RepID=E6TR97_EVAC2|nr:hypothetical protein [Evansella cellulosilytica]ADU30609.1 hypothetical protein Bcell_2350 [Evansella cellulosilytica DSM 2522]
MGKQKAHRSGNPDIPAAQSVNPLGKSPDDARAGEIISEGHEKAKKSNTKR